MPYVACASFSLARMVFLGGHPTQYLPQSVQCAAKKSVRASSALSGIIADLSLMYLLTLHISTV